MNFEMKTLAEERANPPFDVEAMAVANHGSKERLDYKRKVMSEIERLPAFFNDDFYDLTKDQLRERTFIKIGHIVNWFQKEDMATFRQRLELIDQIGLFPGEEIAVRLAAEMAIGGGAAIDRAAQVQMLADAKRREVHHLCQRALDLAVQWCRDRQTFGRPLISRQHVQMKLADMQRKVDVARVYTRALVERAEAGETNLITEVCFAKNTAVENGAWVVNEALQLFGGMGYMRESEVERIYRDFRIIGIGGGTDEIMTMLASKLLGYQ